MKDDKNNVTGRFAVKNRLIEDRSYVAAGGPAPFSTRVKGLHETLGKAMSAACLWVPVPRGMRVPASETVGLRIKPRRLTVSVTVTGSPRAYRVLAMRCPLSGVRLPAYYRRAYGALALVCCGSSVPPGLSGGGGLWVSHFGCAGVFSCLSCLRGSGLSSVGFLVLPSGAWRVCLSGLSLLCSSGLSLLGLPRCCLVRGGLLVRWVLPVRCVVRGACVVLGLAAGFVLGAFVFVRRVAVCAGVGCRGASCANATTLLAIQRDKHHSSTPQ